MKELGLSISPDGFPIRKNNIFFNLRNEFLPSSVWGYFQYQMEYELLYGEHFYDLTWNNGYSHKQILSDIKVPCVFLHAKNS
ncbi:hypothetical protein SAMN04487770_108143 [Butyrivibrio sp. ob235]|nr:hypothetical protein SAMN04487770_108143 [Butyrivibrio sp. ob235]